MAAVRASFKPEFLNRLDDVIVFDALTTEELASIVDIQVARLASWLSARRLTLSVSQAAKDWLALTGFDPVYGLAAAARPVGDRRQAGQGAALRRGHRRRRGDRGSGRERR